MVSPDDPTLDLDADDELIVARFADVLADESTWLEVPATLGAAVSEAIASERRQLVGDGPFGRQSLPPPLPVTAQPAQPSRTARRLAPLVAAAAAAVAALALGAVIGRSTGGTDSDRQVAVSATDLAPDVEGSVGVRTVTSGVELRIDAPGLPRRDGGDFYEGWLKSCDGTQLVPIGTFHELSDVTAWAGVSTDDFPILTVTRETVAAPQDVAQGSSGEVVLTAQVGPDCPS